jgi:beta-N-acetylhexosaminidase
MLNATDYNPTSMPRVVRAVLPTLALLAVGCATITPPDGATFARLDPLLGQLLLVGFDGTDGVDNAEIEQLVCTSRVGGVLLFSRNVADAAQVQHLTGWIRARAAACNTPSPLVAMDAEGGRVMRLSPRAGYTPTPSAQELAGENDLALTELEARRIGRMLREAGVTWDLAPVVDVGYNPANTVIVGAGRSYGAHPLAVAAHARAFIRGLHAEGVLSTLKHFPGHGSSFADSHEGFVDVSDTADRDVELVPYRVLVGERVVDAVMTAHVFNRRLDERDPATLSHATITGLLRNDLGWDGPVVSDDLRMGAIEQHYGLAQAAVQALDAGVDILLIAEDRLPDGRSAAAVALTAIRAALIEGRLAPERVMEALSHAAMLKRRALGIRR